MTYQNGAPAHSIGVPTPRVITESVRRPPRVVIVVQTRGSAPSSSRYRGTNPGFGGLLESLSWCQPLLESLSWYKPGVRRPPRVTIVVQTVGLADWIGLPNPHSCRYCGTNPGFDFLLESLSWFKPGERLSLATRWMCQYPYGKDTGCKIGRAHV